MQNRPTDHAAQKQTPKELLEAASRLSKQQLFKFVTRLLRLMPLTREDIPDLEVLIDEIDDAIAELEVLGDEEDAPHPTIKVQIKPRSYNGKLLHYFYLRRKLPGQKAEDKGFGAIPFKPGNLYRLIHKSTGQQRLLKCVRAYVPQRLSWEELMQQPQCYLEMAWLDETLAPIATETFEFPRCMEENFSPRQYELEALTAEPPSPRPPAAQSAPGTRLNLSRSQLSSTPSTKTTLTLTPAQVESVIVLLRQWLELSHFSEGKSWSLLERPKQSIVIDEKQQQLFILRGNQLTILISAPQLIRLLAQMAEQVTASARPNASWKQVARDLLTTVRKADRYSGDRVFLALLKL